MKRKMVIIMFLVLLFSLSIILSISANEEPFKNPIEPVVEKSSTGESFSYVTIPENKDGSRDPFKNPLEAEQKNPVIEKEKKMVKDNKYPQKEEVSGNKESRKGKEVVSQSLPLADGKLFSYKGVLWNGYQYLGIVTSGKNCSIVRIGDELKDGYSVLYLDEKEMLMVKEGKKISVKLQ